MWKKPSTTNHALGSIRKNFNRIAMVARIDLTFFFYGDILNFRLQHNRSSLNTGQYVQCSEYKIYCSILFDGSCLLSGAIHDLQHSHSCSLWFIDVFHRYSPCFSTEYHAEFLYRFLRDQIRPIRLQHENSHYFIQAILILHYAA